MFVKENPERKKKFDTKFILTLETDMNRLFETNIQAAAIASPEPGIYGMIDLTNHMNKLDLMKISVNIFKQL